MTGRSARRATLWSFTSRGIDSRLLRTRLRPRAQELLADNHSADDECEHGRCNTITPGKIFLRRGRCWKQPRGDVRDGPATLRIQTQALPRNLQKWRRNSFWQQGISLPDPFPERRPLRQCLHERHTERPYVPGRREPRGRRLGRIVDRPHCVGRLLVGPGYTIAGDFQFLFHGHHVGWPKTPMNQSMSMQIRERFENRAQHVLGLG